MAYRLFIDDERLPPADDNRWVIGRTMADVILIIRLAGFPSFISFDHDLGDGQPSGHDIAKWMVAADLDASCIPAGFAYTVHSQNPVGAKNIRGLLDGYLRHREGGGEKS